MLLDIMSFARNITTDNLSSRQSDLCSLALSGIRFFGFRHSDFEAYAFHTGTVLVRHGGRDRAAFWLGRAGGAADLVEGCEEGRGCVEDAAGWERDAAGEGGVTRGCGWADEGA